MPIPFRIDDLVNDWTTDVSFVPCVDDFGLVPVGSTCLIYGNYGCGKTRLATALAGQARCAGRPVLILDLENPPPAVVAIRSQGDLPKDDPNFIWWHGATRRVKADGAAVFEQPSDPDSPVVGEWLARKSGALVVLDSIGRALARRGVDENATSEVNARMDAWARATIGVGATLIYLHHVNKSGALRGSVAIPGNVDQAYEIIAKKDTSGKLTGAEVRPEKTRIKLVEPIELRYDEGKFSLGGEAGREGFAAL